jgi:hypothetical protein
VLGRPGVAFAVSRLAWQIPAPSPHGRLAQLGAVHQSPDRCYVAYNRSATLVSVAGLHAPMLRQNRRPSFSIASRLRLQEHILPAPALHTATDNPWPRLCAAAVNGLWLVLGVRAKPHTPSSTHSLPWCTHSVAARLKTTLESLGMRPCVSTPKGFSSPNLGSHRVSAHGRP